MAWGFKSPSSHHSNPLILLLFQFFPLWGYHRGCQKLEGRGLQRRLPEVIVAANPLRVAGEDHFRRSPYIVRDRAGVFPSHEAGRNERMPRVIERSVADLARA